MRGSALPKPGTELESIRTAFVKVRMLHSIAQEPGTATAITERLGLHGGPGRAGRILANLVRVGLLRAKTNGEPSGRQYYLTAKGRRQLAIASQHLPQLPEKI